LIHNSSWGIVKVQDVVVGSGVGPSQLTDLVGKNLWNPPDSWTKAAFPKSKKEVSARSNVGDGGTFYN